MTVNEIMNEINFIRNLASSLDKICVEGTAITYEDSCDIERAGELLRDYADELGRKKVV